MSATATRGQENDSGILANDPSDPTSNGIYNESSTNSHDGHSQKSSMDANGTQSMTSPGNAPQTGKKAAKKKAVDPNEVRKTPKDVGDISICQLTHEFCVKGL